MLSKSTFGTDSMWFARAKLAFVFSILFATGASAQTGICTGSSDIACTEQGAVRGVAQGATMAFKGIPYAAPPVGPLRWKPPAPPARWDGVRDGSSFGAGCPQIVGEEVKGDENCLYINVWRPREKPDRPLPVMVWLHGGGNHTRSGEGSADFGGVGYNGEQLVPQGGVFVSFNARLGVLGFLSHAALSAERPEKISGNYGSLDQIAMLQWINRNIAAFGGDPSRVFLFGTSAGGGNICALITSPLTRGLVHGVAMESSVPAGCEIKTLAEDENETGRRVVKAAGCDAAPDIAACLRGKSVTEIVKVVPGTFSVFPRIYGPNMDGHVFPEQPIKIIMAQRHAAMPVIIGNTARETWGWSSNVTDESSYAGAIDKAFGSPARDRILKLYPASAYPSVRAAFVQATTDAQFTCVSRRVARALSKAQKEPVFRYIFDHTLENDPQLKVLGANHTIEHTFLFAWQGRYRPTDTDLAVQRRIVGYWTRLAKAGNPNGGGDPEWPADSGNDTYLEIGANTGAKTGPAAANCDFWDEVPMLWPHL
jgi:para-nitrobenzyl esterase